MGMKNNLQSHMALLGLAAAFSEGPGMYQEDIRKPTICIPKEPPVPKGAKTYWFDEQGNFSSEQMRKDEVVFICIAINNKNAIKKYDRWKKKNF